MLAAESDVRREVEIRSIGILAEIEEYSSYYITCKTQREISKVFSKLLRSFIDVGHFSKLTHCSSAMRFD